MDAFLSGVLQSHGEHRARRKRSSDSGRGVLEDDRAIRGYSEHPGSKKEYGGVGLGWDISASCDDQIFPEEPEESEVW